MLGVIQAKGKKAKKVQPRYVATPKDQTRFHC